MSSIIRGNIVEEKNNKKVNKPFTRVIFKKNTPIILSNEIVNYCDNIPPKKPKQEENVMKIFCVEFSLFKRS